MHGNFLEFIEMNLYTKVYKYIHTFLKLNYKIKRNRYDIFIIKFIYRDSVSDRFYGTRSSDKILISSIVDDPKKVTAGKKMVTSPITSSPK